MRNLADIIFILLFYSCNADKDMESALKSAGENREELETVLNYYANDCKDSLKLKAAKFLIKNIPIYYSYNGMSLDNFKNDFSNTIETGYAGKEALDETQKSVGFPILNQLTVTRDIKVISAEYLIENIEHSFKVRQEQPWGKHISFASFCEYILPYRIENKPIENWESAYYQRYQPILDSLLINDDILDACNIIYEHIVQDSWSFILEMPEPHLGAEFLRTGSCRDRCDLAIYVMRSLGIPVGTDMVLQSPDQSNRHFGSFVLDNNGDTVEFTLWEESPIKNYSTELEKKRGKVYRGVFNYKEDRIGLLRKV